MSVDEADARQNDGQQPLTGDGSGAEQLTQGLVRSMMNSEPFERTVDRVEDNRLAVRQLIRNLYYLETQVAIFETRQEANEERIRELSQQLQEERKRSATLAARVEDLMEEDS